MGEPRLLCSLELPLQLKLNNMSDTANNKFSNLLI